MKHKIKLDYKCVQPFFFYGRFSNVLLRLLLQQRSITKADGHRFPKAAGTEVILERQGAVLSLRWNCTSGCVLKKPRKEQSCNQLHNLDSDTNK